jgi:hypothetical protein
VADRSVVVRLIANTAGFAAPLKAAAVQAKAFGAEIDAGSKKNSDGFKKISETALVAGGGIRRRVRRGRGHHHGVRQADEQRRRGGQRNLRAARTTA